MKTNEHPTDHRAMLRSSFVMGLATVANIGAGLVKMKAAALLLGPAGVGLLGLLQNLVQFGATTAALGMGSAGTREIARADATGDQDMIARVRATLFWGALMTAVVGAATFVLFGGAIAELVLGDRSEAATVAWLSVAVFLSVAAMSQRALLTGLRRIGEVARLQTASGVAGATLGVLAIWWLGRDGLVAAIVVAALATFIVGHWFVARLDRPTGARPSIPELLRGMRGLASLGVAIMLGSLVEMAGQLALRSALQQRGGADLLGQFQASWSIGMMYMTLVLGAMSADYLPSLAGALDKPARAREIVNSQTEVAVLLCGPPLLAMIALAPWVIRLLYSPEFGVAAEILRWQLIGDVFKVIAWPLGFVILAAGRGKIFVATQTFAVSTLFGVTIWLLPRFGVVATGIAFLVSQIALLPLCYLIALRLIGFRWNRAVMLQSGILLGAVLATTGSLAWSELAGEIMGVLLSSALGVHAVVRLGRLGGVGGRAGRLLERIHQFFVA
jgi:O-antigen/teichoic acid export membrane protein